MKVQVVEPYIEEKTNSFTYLFQNFCSDDTLFWIESVFEADKPPAEFINPQQRQLGNVLPIQPEMQRLFFQSRSFTLRTSFDNGKILRPLFHRLGTFVTLL